MNKQEVLTHFLENKSTLISQLESLDEGRLNQIPFPGSWTAGQLGEHILKSFQAFDLSKVKAIPAQRPNGEKSPQIDAVFLDFTTKYQTLDFIAPSSAPLSREDLLARLRATSDQIVDYAETHDLAFTSPDFEIIGFGELTALEWIHFLTAHTKRHLHQLHNILGNLQ